MDLKHPRKELRASAAGMLATLADPRAADAFLEGLSSPDGDVRREAALALGRLRDRRAVEPLLGLLGDEFWGVREGVAAALGVMYEPRFLDALVGAARRDAEPMVRRTATRVLIENSHDPVAIRLGWRYRPLSIAPSDQAAVQQALFIYLSGTSLVLCVAAWLAVRLGREREKPEWVRIGLPAMIAASLGFGWGYFMLGLSREIENVLLLGWVPLTAVFAYWVGVAFRFSARDVARRIWLLTIASFYAGYGIGWLALWGYLGF